MKVERASVSARKTRLHKTNDFHKNDLKLLGYLYYILCDLISFTYFVKIMLR